MDFEALVDRHKDSVYRQMVRVCSGNHADAEDSLAEALLSAFKSSSQLRDDQNFSAWLTRIGSRVCVHMRKKAAIQPFLDLLEMEATGHELASAEPSPGEQLEMAQMRTCVHSALDSLSPSYRDVYVRREIEGQPATQVAEELGISLANVKTRLHRARMQVRHSLDQSVCGQP